MTRASLVRLLLPIAAATTLLLGSTTAALGKCEHGDTEMCDTVVATLDFPGTLRAGTDTDVAVWVHFGDEPFDAMSVALVFSRIGDGTLLTFPAEPTSLAGRYVADVTLPAGGGWNVIAQVVALSGDEFSQPLTTLRVVNLPGLPANPSAPATPAPITLPWVWVPLLAATLIGLAALSFRRLRARPSSA